jgi:hypothetical protein
VVSFGILEGSGQFVRVATWHTLSNQGVSDVVERGLSRLRRVDSSLESLGNVGHLVHIPILERMRSDGVVATDVLNVSQLVTALKKKPYGSWDRRVKLTNGQRSLFW